MLSYGFILTPQGFPRALGMEMGRVVRARRSATCMPGRRLSFSPALSLLPFLVWTVGDLPAFFELVFPVEVRPVDQKPASRGSSEGFVGGVPFRVCGHFMVGACKVPRTWTQTGRQTDTAQCRQSFSRGGVSRAQRGGGVSVSCPHSTVCFRVLAPYFPFVSR